MFISYLNFSLFIFMFTRQTATKNRRKLYSTVDFTEVIPISRLAYMLPLFEHQFNRFLLILRIPELEEWHGNRRSDPFMDQSLSHDIPQIYRYFTASIRHRYPADKFQRCERRGAGDQRLG